MKDSPQWVRWPMAMKVKGIPNNFAYHRCSSLAVGWDGAWRCWWYHWIILGPKTLDQFLGDVPVRGSERYRSVSVKDCAQWDKALWMVSLVMSFLFTPLPWKQASYDTELWRIFDKFLRANLGNLMLPSFFEGFIFPTSLQRSIQNDARHKSDSVNKSAVVL